MASVRNDRAHDIGVRQLTVWTSSGFLLPSCMQLHRIDMSIIGTRTAWAQLVTGARCHLSELCLHYTRDYSRRFMCVDIFIVVFLCPAASCGASVKFPSGCQPLDQIRTIVCAHTPQNVPTAEVELHKCRANMKIDNQCIVGRSRCFRIT